MDYEQLSKFFSGELPPEEKESFLASLEADEELMEEAARLKNSWVAAQLADAPGDAEIARKGWERFNESIKLEGVGSSETVSKAHGFDSRSYLGSSGKKSDNNRGENGGISKGGAGIIRIWSSWRVAVAAAAAVILIVASYFTGGYLANNKTSAMAYHTLTVPAGQYAQLTLSDGSEIWLNACSKLIYPEKFTSRTREIRLEGEGMFKVASNPKKPFIVKTELLDVIATGTQFNVSAYPDDNWILATLIEGVVKLQPGYADAINNTGYADVPSAHDLKSGYALKAGQIAIYDKQERSITTKNTDTEQQISWIHGEYQFEKTTLEDFAKRFERYYNMVIVFEDESLKQREFNGTFFNSQSIETILNVIATSTDMQYRISDNIIYIK